MKFKYHIALVLFLSLSNIISRPSQSTEESRTWETISVNFNLIDVNMSNSGFLVDYHHSNGPGMEWPAGSSNFIDFQSGMWFAGIINNNIHTAINEYASEFSPGPVNSNPDSDSTRFYIVSLDEINNNYLTSDILEWPWQDGAPWIDENNNGIYEPEIGDKPEMHGNLMVWFTSNDNVPESHILYGTPPLGIEVSYLIWAYWGNYNDLSLQSTLFTKVFITNQSENDIEEFRIGIWDDPDIGDAGDDFVGCNPSLNLGYAYNDGSDFIYGDNTPAIGRVILNTTGNLNMSSFTKMVNGDAIFHDPESAQETYNYLSGLNAYGQPFINSETGEESFFVHPCDPNDNAGVGDGCWVDSDDHSSGDRRYLMSIGPVDLQSSESVDILFATIISNGSSELESVTRLFDESQNIIDFYNNGYIVDEENTNPEVEVIDFAVVADNLNHNGMWDTGETIQLELTLFNYNTIFDDTLEFLINVNSSNGDVNLIENHTQLVSISSETQIITDPVIIHIPFDFPEETVAFTIQFIDENQIELINTQVITIPIFEFQGHPELISVDQLAGFSDNEIGYYIVNFNDLTGDDYEISFTEVDSITQIIIDEFEEGLRDSRDTITVLKLNLLNQTTGTYLLQDYPLPDNYGFEFPITDGFKLHIGTINKGFHGVYMVHNGSETTENNSDAEGMSVLQEHVWQYYDGVLEWASNSNGGFYFATQGGGIPASYDSYLDRVLRGDNWERAANSDFEMRFTEQGSQCWLAYSSNEIIDVPFEIWNIGNGTYDDTSDDYQMICWIYDMDGSESFSWSGDLEDSGAENDPGTDWLYWRDPENLLPGTTGYDETVANGYLYPEFAGEEVFARTVWNNWNGYGSTVDSILLTELSDPNPSNWTITDTIIFNNRGWFLDPVNSLSGVTIEGEFAYGLIIEFPAEGSIYRWITNKPVTLGDIYHFSTANYLGGITELTIPAKIELFPVYPNPFNPETTISYELHKGEDINLSIYEISGRKLEELENGFKAPGKHFILWNAIQYPSGIYFVKLKMDDYQITQKLILVK